MLANQQMLAVQTKGMLTKQNNVPPEGSKHSVPPSVFPGLLSEFKCSDFLDRDGIPWGSSGLVLYTLLWALRISMAKGAKTEPTFKAKMRDKGHNKKEYMASGQEKKPRRSLELISWTTKQIRQEGKNPNNPHSREDHRSLSIPEPSPSPNIHHYHSSNGRHYSPTGTIPLLAPAK